MSIPKIEALSGAYILQWADEGVQVTATHLSDERDGVKAEITIETQNGHGLQHLHRGRLNLLSTTSQATMIKRLESQWNSGVAYSWLEIIEQTCMEVMKRHRQGDPVINLADVKPGENLRYRLWPLLVERRLNMIFGPGGSGKSKLAALVALMVSEGYSTLGWMPEPGPVLYLDWETTPEEVKEVVEALKRGLGYEAPESIKYKRCYQALSVELPEIQRLVLQHGIQLLIVDSVGAAIGEEPDKNASAIRLAADLRMLNITVLAIDHITKEAVENKTGENHAYGGIYKDNYFRWTWEVKRVQEEDSNVINIGLFHRKHNNSRKLSPIGLTITHENEGEGPGEHLVSATVKRAALEETALAENLTMSRRIQHLLAAYRTPMSVQALAEELGTKDADYIRTTLNRGKGKEFIRLDNGKETTWTLTSHREDNQ